VNYSNKNGDYGDDSNAYSNNLSFISGIINDRLLDEVSALLAVANALYRTKRYEDAKALIPTALELLSQASQNTRREELSALLETLHGMVLSVDDGSTAENQFASALKRFSSVENHLGRYIALIAEGIRLQEAKQPSKALAMFKEAESIDRAYDVLQNSIERYKLQCNITSTLSDLGNTRALIEQITTAVQWIPPEPCEELFALFIQKANYCTFYGNFSEALKVYNRALTTAQELNKLDLQALSLARIALCYRTWWEQTQDLSLLEKSTDFRYNAARIYSQNNSFEDALIQWKEIVSAYQKLGQQLEAKEASLQALSLAKEANLGEQVFRFSAHAAFLTTSLNEYQQALDLYLIAYKAKAPNQHDAHKVIAEIARLYYALGNVESALEWFEKSCKMLAQLDEVKKEIEEREIIIYLLSKQGRADDTEQHLMRLKQLNKARTD
jgi:tetratricopeptide (TPR) repeat protein